MSPEIINAFVSLVMVIYEQQLRLNALVPGGEPVGVTGAHRSIETIAGEYIGGDGDQPDEVVNEVVRLVKVIHSEWN